MGTPLVVVGSLNMDVVCRVARAPGAGETVLGEQVSFVPGGKGANQAVACARMGGSVRMVGRVGADAFGARLRDGLAREGIDVSDVGVDAASVSGVAIILVEADGENRITVAPGANARLAPADVRAPARHWPRGGWLLLQLETPLDTVATAIDCAVEAGLRIILNPAPAQALPASWWRHIDVLVPNEGEASLLAGVAAGEADSAVRAARELRRRGVRHVLVTLGGEGALIVDDAGERYLPAPRVEVVDTTAAGDTFTGALAVALAEGLDMDAAAGLAIEAAAIAVTRDGAQTSIPHRGELRGAR